MVLLHKFESAQSGDAAATMAMVNEYAQHPGMVTAMELVARKYGIGQ